MGNLARSFRRIANEIAEMPGIRHLAEPLYRREFSAKRSSGNAYFGVYPGFEEARQAVPASLPGDFDSAAAANLYEYRFSEIESSDYPALFWLGRLLEQGQRRIFDLGGHVGVSYYAYQQHLEFPTDLRWQVHDTASVMEKGRDIARERDPAQRLEFVDLEIADGCDVLMAKGSLQYLDYSLAELIQRMRVPPRHLLVNLTPMHPSLSFFTLQHIGIAVCPYRVTAVPKFLFDIRALGYRLNVRWDHPERSVRVPFHPDYSIDRYHGFHFFRD